MGKAILVMNMPSYCDGCPCCCSTEHFFVAYCQVKKKTLDDIYTKPEWCPLREVPEKQVHNAIDNEFQRGAKNGWNSCVNKILGGAI